MNCGSRLERRGNKRVYLRSEYREPLWFVFGRGKPVPWTLEELRSSFIRWRGHVRLLGIEDARCIGAAKALSEPEQRWYE